jgi:DNA-binding transcriptional LysR family regulator
MMRPTMQALEVFLSIARHGNFRRAAVERGVTASALSHLMRGLEENLGVRLFHRTSRSVALTEAGRHLLERMGPSFNELTQVLDNIKGFRDRPAGLLRLNAPRIAVELVFEPIVAAFLAAYPEIRLEIVTTDDLVDIVAEGFDAGIRRDRRLAVGMIAVPLSPARRFAVVGAPSYFAQFDPPRTPADLHDHSCIGRLFPDGSRYAWEFAREDETFQVEVSGPLAVDDTRLMLRAALDGAGLAFVYRCLVADELKAGRLIQVLDEWCSVEARFFLYYAGRRQIPVPLRTFIDFVQAARVRR